MRIGLALVGAAGACLLAGCTVPDSRLVAQAPQSPSIATVQMVEAQSGRVPLVTIAAAAGPADYVSALAGAVEAGTPLHQITEARGVTPDAAEVATAIMGDGVPPGRITLGAVVVPGIGENQVRVYVR
jgi:hypothetical protein